MRIALLLILLLPFLVVAKDIAIHTKRNGVKITLTDEPCKLKEMITNLPSRATWEENGSIIEGCYGAMRVNQTVVLLPMYWADKTVVIDVLHNYTMLEGV